MLYGQLEFREELLEQLTEMFGLPKAAAKQGELEVEVALKYWPDGGHPYQLAWVEDKKNCCYCYWKYKPINGPKNGRESKPVCNVLYVPSIIAVPLNEIASRMPMLIRHLCNTSKLINEKIDSDN